MSTKILDLLAQLEAHIDDSPRPRMGGSTKRIVDVEPLRDLFSDLRVTIPDEIRWAQSILSERDEILEKARQEAETIVLEAKEQREKLLDDSNIIREANRRAAQTLSRSRESAEMVTSGARNYTDDILLDLQRYLREYIDIIDQNREELHQAYTPGAAAEEPQENGQLSEELPPQEEEMADPQQEAAAEQAPLEKGVHAAEGEQG